MWAGAYAKEMSVNFYFLELYFFFLKRGFPNYYGDNHVTLLLRFINVVHYTNE